MTDELTRIGEAVMWFAGVTVAAGVLVRSRPARWLGRTLIANPVMSAFHREVTSVVRSEVPAAIDDAMRRHPLTNGYGNQAASDVADATNPDAHRTEGYE